MIVSFALVEGAVMFGLIVGFLSRNPKDLIVPAVIGMVGFGAHFPKWEEWQRWAREM